MSLKKLLTGVIFYIICFGTIYSQETTVASGGSISDTGGSISYSIGIVSYNSYDDTGGVINQGLQYAFEIVTILNIHNEYNNIKLIAYPNPTTTNLTLNTKNLNDKVLKYQLFDIQGKLLISESLNQQNTSIKMEQLPAALYFLKIINNNTTVKIFKIIKK